MRNLIITVGVDLAFLILGFLWGSSAERRARWAMNWKCPEHGCAFTVSASHEEPVRVLREQHQRWHRKQTR